MKIYNSLEDVVKDMVNAQVGELGDEEKRLSRVEAPDREMYETIKRPPFNGSITTYPYGDENQRGIYNTRQRLRGSGLLIGRMPLREGGVVHFEIVR